MHDVIDGRLALICLAGGLLFYVVGSLRIAWLWLSGGEFWEVFARGDWGYEVQRLGSVLLCAGALATFYYSRR